MARRNEDDGLRGIKDRITTQYREHFGTDHDPKLVDIIVDGLLLEEQRRFITNRVEHLQGEDLLAFKRILSEKEVKESTPEAGAESNPGVAGETGVAQESGQSSEDVEARLRRGSDSGGNELRADGSKKNNRGRARKS